LRMGGYDICPPSSPSPSSPLPSPLTRTQTVHARMISPAHLTTRTRSRTRLRARTQTDAIVAGMEQLVQAWGDMADTIEDRAELLASAHEIHTFYEQCETTAARIGEKSVVASRTDYGDVLAAVETLIAEHKVFEIDLEAVRKRVTDLAAECSALQSKFPQKEAELTDKLTSVNEAWAKLQELTAARRAALTQSLHFERFVVNHARVLDWVNDVIRQIEDTVPSDEVDQAEELTQEHGKLKAEIDARASDVQDVVTEGAELVDNYEPLEPKVKSMLDNLSGRESMMRSLWEQTDKVLRETSEGLSFERETHQAMALLKSTQERLDAATLDPSKSSSAEILELMAAVNALERSIQVRLLSLYPHPRLPLPSLILLCFVTALFEDFQFLFCTWLPSSDPIQSQCHSLSIGVLLLQSHAASICQAHLPTICD
jgi:predicted  nucleic acid-binding Zn-ribbon protein